MDFPEEIFPPVVKNNDVIGEVTERAARETSLRKGTPVIAGGADTQCGLIGTGSIEDGDTTAVAGTSICMQMALKEPVIDPNMRAWTHCHAVTNRWTVESIAGGEGMAFKWLSDTLAESYDSMNRQAEITPVGSNQIMSFLGTWVHNSSAGGFVSPPGSIIGLTFYTPTNKGSIFRAFMEGTAFAVRANCTQLEEISSLKIKELRLCGGLGQSTTLAQILADVLGVPVRVADVKEATSLGATICASIGAGIYDNLEEAIDKTVRWEATMEPNEKTHETYNDLFSKWIKFFHGMIELSKEADVKISLI